MIIIDTDYCKIYDIHRLDDDMKIREYIKKEKMDNTIEYINEDFDIIDFIRENYNVNYDTKEEFYRNLIQYWFYEDELELLIKNLIEDSGYEIKKEDK